MWPRLITIVALASLVAGTACAASTTGQPSARQDADTRPAAESSGGAKPATAPAVPGAPVAAQSADAARQTLPSTFERMIIRTVSLTLGVADVQDAYRQVERIASEQGGMVANSQVRQEGDRTVATVTVRVAADPATYQATLERLRAVAEKVTDEQVQSQDVTEEYVDLDSRLRNLRATEDSLVALLGRAQRVEDILQIQRELTQVRGQIEQVQGRRQVLERRTEMATINLQIRELAVVGRGGWTPSGTFAEALRALAAAGLALATLAIWAVVWSPLWGAVVLAAWLVRRARRGSNLRAAPAGGTAGAGGA